MQNNIDDDDDCRITSCSTHAERDAIGFANAIDCTENEPMPVEVSSEPAVPKKRKRNIVNYAAIQDMKPASLVKKEKAKDGPPASPYSVAKVLPPPPAKPAAKALPPPTPPARPSKPLPSPPSPTTEEGKHWLRMAAGVWSKAAETKPA